MGATKVLFERMRERARQEGLQEGLQEGRQEMRRQWEAWREENVKAGRDVPELPAEPPDAGNEQNRTLRHAPSSLEYRTTERSRRCRGGIPVADADRERGRGPATPQEIWNILREVSDVAEPERDRPATCRETMRRMQETDQLLKRQGQETDRRLRKLDELINANGQQPGKADGSPGEGDLIALLRLKTQLRDTEAYPWLMRIERGARTATPQEIWNILREVSSDRRMQETDRRCRRPTDKVRRPTGACASWMSCSTVSGESCWRGDLIALLRQRGKSGTEEARRRAGVGTGHRGVEWCGGRGGGGEDHPQGARRRSPVGAVARLPGSGAGVFRQAGVWGRRLSEGRSILGRSCGTAGPVRDSRDRQQRQHHQSRGLPAARVRAGCGTSLTCARCRQVRRPGSAET